MPSQAGSLELLVCAVSEALAPLVDLDIGTTKAVAANLGLSVPDALAANTAFLGVLSTIAKNANALRLSLQNLSDAIEADDLLQITAVGAALIERVLGLITAIGQLDKSISSFAAMLIKYLIILYFEVAMPALTAH